MIHCTYNRSIHKKVPVAVRPSSKVHLRRAPNNWYMMAWAGLSVGISFLAQGGISSFGTTIFMFDCCCCCCIVGTCCTGGGDTRREEEDGGRGGGGEEVEEGTTTSASSCCFSDAVVLCMMDE